MSNYIQNLKGYVDATNTLKQLERDLKLNPLDEQTRAMRKKVELRLKLNKINWGKIVQANAGSQTTRAAPASHSNLKW